MNDDDRQAIETLAVGIRAMLSDEQLAYLSECLTIQSQDQARKTVAVLRQAGIIPDHVAERFPK